MASPQIFEDLSSVFSILLQKKSEHTFLYYPLFQDYLNLLTLVAYMLQYPHRRPSKIIQIEKGSSMGGFTVVRGKHPIGKGRKDTILLLIREDIKGNIVNFSVIIIDGKEYVPNVYYDFDGRKAEE